jgi:dimethylargininase
MVMTKSIERPYVVSDAGTLASAIVRPPTLAVAHLSPLQAEPAPIAERAIEAHAVLVTTLRDRGVDVTVLPPDADVPTGALVGDLALILNDGALMMRPSDPERRRDFMALEAALTAMRVPIIGRIEAPGLLDAGDVAIAGNLAYVAVPRPGAGLRSRSNELGRRQFAAYAQARGLTMIELPVAPTVARLRNVFNVIGGDTVIAAPERVDLVPVRDMKVVEVPRGEEYAAGVLAFGERRVIANLRFRESIRVFRKAKIEVEAIDLWEFGKAGVSPAALVLAVKRT